MKYFALAKKSNIPPLFFHQKLSDYQVSDSNRDIFEVVQVLNKRPEFISGMYLHGSIGTGKTMLACILGKALLRFGKSVRFIDPYELHDSFLKVYKYDRTAKNHELQKLDFLIIDNLGIERFEACELQQLARLIDTRCQAKRNNIITSIYSLPELKEKMLKDAGTENEAIVNRLISCIHGASTVIKITGEDYRMNQLHALK